MSWNWKFFVLFSSKWLIIKTFVITKTWKCLLNIDNTILLSPKIFEFDFLATFVQRGEAFRGQNSLYWMQITFKIHTGGFICKNLTPSADYQMIKNLIEAYVANWQKFELVVQCTLYLHQLGLKFFGGESFFDLWRGYILMS